MNRGKQDEILQIHRATIISTMQSSKRGLSPSENESPVLPKQQRPTSPNAAKLIDNSVRDDGDSENQILVTREKSLSTDRDRPGRSPLVKTSAETNVPKSPTTGTGSSKADDVDKWEHLLDSLFDFLN